MGRTLDQKIKSFLMARRVKVKARATELIAEDGSLLMGGAAEPKRNIECMKYFF